MARRASQGAGAGGAAQAAHRAYLAYQLGALPTRLRAAAVALWWSADAGDPLPPSTRAWAECLADLVDRLAPPGSAEPLVLLRGEVLRVSRCWLDAFERGWGGTEHRDLTAQRDDSDP